MMGVDDGRCGEWGSLMGVIWLINVFGLTYLLDFFNFDSALS